MTPSLSIGKRPYPVRAGAFVPRAIFAGLMTYMTVKGVLWMMDFGAVVDLLTKADHAIYMRQAERVLAGGPLYNPWQLAGPYTLAQLPELYPPQTVYGLIVPMSLLPDPLWWIVPLAVIVAVVAYWRPRPWAWVAILLCLAVPHTWTSIAAGNPALWAAAFVAIGTRYRWVAIGAVLKPTLALFALTGVRTQGWWVAAAVLAATTLLLLPAWLEYITVLRNNAQGTLLYSLGNFPLMAIPLVAYLGSGVPRVRTKGAPATVTSSSP